MSLFQNSVVNKYLKEANHAEMQAAYQKLVGYFHNSVILQNIRESMEEQFQEGFLRELFVHVLGYTINPDPDYNLTSEFKNERGARKADGAILQQQGSMLPCAAIAVIELKSTTTKDLESIRLQAFDYKAHHSKCVYVVTSNFEKLRFYINNAVDFEEFQSEELLLTCHRPQDMTALRASKRFPKSPCNNFPSSIRQQLPSPVSEMANNSYIRSTL